MTGWLLAALVLIVLGIGPAMWLGVRGDAVARLIGLELGTAATVLTLLVLAQASGQAQLLIVPLVLVVLSFAGTLVFTRLLATQEGR
jgi:multisubunit Na+/H+ antiporter MnhF subunit